MTDIEIRYFLEIVNQGVSFTKASQVLHISQPALTKHINTLGKQLGVKLINTSNKSAPVLTQEGKLFYQFFSECQKKFEETQHKAKNIVSSELRLAGISDWDMEILLSKKKKFARLHPDINISLATCGFKELQNGFLENRYDFVLTMTDHFRGMQNITIHECYSGNCFLVFSSSHPLASQNILSIDDFKDDFLYLVSKDNIPFLWKNNDKYFKSIGITPNFKQFPDINSIIVNLQLGSGYTIMDEWIYSRNYKKLKSVPLDLTFSASFVWKNNNANKALKLFLETCVL